MSISNCLLLEFGWSNVSGSGLWWRLGNQSSKRLVALILSEAGSPNMTKVNLKCSAGVVVHDLRAD